MNETLKKSKKEFIKLFLLETLNEFLMKSPVEFLEEISGIIPAGISAVEFLKKSQKEYLK